MMTTIKIKGMTCNHCVMAVTKALSEIEGIQDVAVDLSKGEATFLQVEPVDMSIVKEGVKKAGYEVV
jgi:copper chaperone